MDFNEDQVQRYARHIILPEVGIKGQKKLLNSKVLVIGAGGLGSPVLMYLAAAGIGKIGIVDDDTVDLSNLQRQIVHTTNNIKQLKTKSAYATIRQLNPDIEVDLHNTRLKYTNVTEIIERYDIIADGSDNFETRFLVNDACYFTGKTLVSAAVQRFDGQVSTFPFSKKSKFRYALGSDPAKTPSKNGPKRAILGSKLGDTFCPQKVVSKID